VAERVKFHLILPPGWVHIDVGDMAAAQIESFAKTAAATVEPKHRAIAESFLRDYLTRTATDAAAQGGQDLFFPGDPLDGPPTPMSILVAVPPLPPEAGSQPRMQALTAFAASSADSAPVSVGGEPAIRQVRNMPAVVDDNGVTEVPATRTITYALWSPGENSQLITFSGSLLRLNTEDGEYLAEALEFLFDTLIGTIRFETEEATA
jgi:hypothetical protein